MNQRVSKITLLSDDKYNGTINSVSDYTFNRMDMKEQDDMMHLKMMIYGVSQMGGIGASIIQQYQTMVKTMEDKYNSQKPETLFEVKRRLLKQGLK